MILLYKNKEGIQTNRHNNIFSISSIEGNDYKKGGRRENERKKKNNPTKWYENFFPEILFSCKKWGAGWKHGAVTLRAAVAVQMNTWTVMTQTQKKKRKKTIRDFSFFLFSLTLSSWRRSIKTSGLGGGWECTRHQSVHNDIQIYIKCVIRPQCTNI